MSYRKYVNYSRSPEATPSLQDLDISNVECAPSTYAQEFWLPPEQPMLSDTQNIRAPVLQDCYYQAPIVPMPQQIMESPTPVTTYDTNILKLLAAIFFCLGFMTSCIVILMFIAFYIAQHVLVN